jgi:hypothetical protein
MSNFLIIFFSFFASHPTSKINYHSLTKAEKIPFRLPGMELQGREVSDLGEKILEGVWQVHCLGEGQVDEEKPAWFTARIQ